MRRALLFAFLAILSAGLQGYSQARPSEPRSDSKKNNRSRDEAAPSPTPPVLPANPASSDDEVIKVNTQLVSVPVRVMDRKGRFIGGLTRDNFKVFENGVEQEIALFSNENEPFTVALMLDMSYSTKFKLTEIQSAAIAFIDQLRAQDKVMIVSFDGDVHMHCDPTSDRKEIYRAIRSTRIATGTSLYEAVDLVMNDRLREVEGRKAIILFSDGVDTTSRRSNDLRNLHDAMELDALIYTIRYDTFADVQAMKNSGGVITSGPKITIPTPAGTPSPFPIPISVLSTVGTPSSQGTTPEEYQKAAEYLDQLAQRTGGRMYEPMNLGNLADAYTKIASELREFYSVSYYPSEEREAGKTSSVKVRVDQEGAVVRSREKFTNRRLPAPKIKVQNRPE